MPAPLITLLTDYGEADAFVGMLKGALLSRLPAARLVDLSHQLPSGDAAADLFRAALLLRRVYSYYPAGTLHLVGQDAGGGPRRALVAFAGGQVFLAADTGVLGLVLELEPEAQVFAAPLTAPTTFMARDVLVDWAALLANGMAPKALATGMRQVQDWTRLPLPQPQCRDGAIHGQVLHVDSFGNLITNVLRAGVPARATPWQLVIGGVVVTAWSDGYATPSAGELFLIWGAEGWLEIALRHASAAARLGARPGMKVVLR